MGEGRHKVLFVRQPGTPVVSLSGSGGTGIRNDRVLYRLRLYFVIFGLRGWRQMTEKMVLNLVQILSENKRIVIALTDFEKNEKNS
jgi:hypothetical protein